MDEGNYFPKKMDEGTTSKFSSRAFQWMVMSVSFDNLLNFVGNLCVPPFVTEVLKELKRLAWWTEFPFPIPPLQGFMQWRDLPPAWIRHGGYPPPPIKVLKTRRGVVSNFYMKVFTQNIHMLFNDSTSTIVTIQRI
jgi:hypothetical protein